MVFRSADAADAESIRSADVFVVHEELVQVWNKTIKKTASGEPIRCGRSLAVARHEPSPPGLGTRNSCAPAAGVQAAAARAGDDEPGCGDQIVFTQHEVSDEVSSGPGFQQRRSLRPEVLEEMRHSCSRSMASKRTFTLERRQSSKRPGRCSRLASTASSWFFEPIIPSV